MSKKGFTIIELTVVIAIIGILAMTALKFDFNKKTDVEKQDRFFQTINSMIHSTLMASISGRGVNIGANTTINPEKTHILFSTGTIGIYYYSGNTVIGTGKVINSPFFGDANFSLYNSYGRTKSGSTEEIPLPIEIVFSDNNEISFTGSSASLDSVTGIGIGIKYKEILNILEFDRRLGKVIKKDKGQVCLLFERFNPSCGSGCGPGAGPLCPATWIQLSRGTCGGMIFGGMSSLGPTIAECPGP